MKNFFLALMFLSVLTACNQKKSDKKKEVSEQKTVTGTTDQTTHDQADENTKSQLTDPDPDDGVPPEQYSPHNSNIQTAAKIRKFLTENLLKDDLKLLKEKDRRFQYEEVDLNGDGKKEYLVGFKSPYFCGTGGCSFYLLNNDGSVISYFSVSEPPFIALKQKTNGWKDLLVTSDGALRILKFDGKKYPSNPSVAPKFTEIPSDDAYRLLWDAYPIPTFKF